MCVLLDETAEVNLLLSFFLLLFLVVRVCVLAADDDFFELQKSVSTLINIPVDLFTLPLYHKVLPSPSYRFYIIKSLVKILDFLT